MKSIPIPASGLCVLLALVPFSVRGDGAGGASSPPDGKAHSPIRLVADFHAPVIAAPPLSEDSPVRALGQGCEMKVTDREGKVLIESGTEIAITGAAVSPDQRSILVQGANAVSLLLDPATGGKSPLPQGPRTDGRYAIGDWMWVNDHLLVGISGIPDPAAHGCDPPPLETLLYVYDARTKQLSEVELPQAWRRGGVRPQEVSTDGRLHLTLDLPVTDPPSADLGWFRLEEPQ